MVALTLISVPLLAPGALGHAWITHPVSRVELVTNHFQDGMPDNDLRYCPSCTNGPNACFAKGGENEWVQDVSVWQKWYDHAGISVPHLTPGEVVDFRWTTTAEHGGESWVQLSCADSFAENNTWYILNRGDSVGSLPSNPGVLAWRHVSPSHASWVVPSDFSCPKGRGVGRWVWKTGNSCQDCYNYGRNTAQFKMEEVRAIGLGLGCCPDKTEEFGSCFDFTCAVGPSPPAPPPRPPTPTPPPGDCHAISTLVTDSWCNANCPANCPADMCHCGSQVDQVLL